MLEKLSIPLPFYFRYVDDIAMTISSTIVNDILINFNSFHPKLQFTIEIGNDTLNFLDVTISEKGNGIVFNWFHQPTFSERYLNYLSQHQREE